MTLTAAAVLGMAWALSRVWQGQGTSTEPLPAGGEPWYTPPDLSEVVNQWTEPDQTASIFETAIVNMTPSTYTPANVEEYQAQANVRAFLDMIAFAEGTSGPNGYRTLFGGQLFDSYAAHPRIYVPFRNTTSSAAGRYQMLARTWDTLAARLGLPDFSPESQDAAAVELIRERGALNDVRAGRFELAVSKVRKIWASLPGAGYNQPEKNINTLAAAYMRAGGTMEPTA